MRLCPTGRRPPLNRLACLATKPCTINNERQLNDDYQGQRFSHYITPSPLSSRRRESLLVPGSELVFVGGLCFLGRAVLPLLLTLPPWPKPLAVQEHMESLYPCSPGSCLPRTRQALTEPCRVVLAASALHKDLDMLPGQSP